MAFVIDAYPDLRNSEIAQDRNKAIDETGFLKQGDQSVGVQVQYYGTTGHLENCQVGVFLAYITEKGHSLIDRRLYLPKSWTEDPQKCRKAGVPETVKFATIAVFNSFKYNSSDR